MKVLLVDDSKAARFAMSKLLKDQGLEVEVAASGEEALDKIATEKIDIVFMDQSMPGMGGIKATEAITSNEKTKHIPVVLCTGNEGEKLEQMAEEAGAIGVLTKPPEEAKLVAILSSLSKEEHAETIQPEQSVVTEAASAETTAAIAKLQKAIEALQEQVKALQADTQAKIDGMEKSLSTTESKLLSLQSSINQLDSNVSRQIQDALSKEAGNQRIQLEALRQQVETGLDSMSEQEQKLRMSILKEAQGQINHLVNEKLSGLKDGLKDTQHQVDSSIASMKKELEDKAGKGLSIGAIVLSVLAIGAAAGVYFLK